LLLERKHLCQNHITAGFFSDEIASSYPIGWREIDDVPEVSFSVCCAKNFACSIRNVSIPNSIDLGVSNSNLFYVYDEVTDDPIVNIQCQAFSFSADGSPILIEPYGENLEYFSTGHDGLGKLQANFDEKKFKPHTTYRFKLSCTCLNFSNSVCINGNTGEKMGFRTCEVDSIFTTGENLRPISNIDWFRLVFFIVFFSLGCILFYSSNKCYTYIESYVYTIISSSFFFIVGSSILYGYNIIFSTNVNILRINTSLGIINLLLGLWVLIYIIIIKKTRRNKEEKKDEEYNELDYY
jgi:hypothetical protein